MFQVIVRFLRNYFRVEEPDPSTSGFGQTAADDLRFAARFRQLKKQPIPWRAATAEEYLIIEQHLILNRFGDYTIAIADHQGERLILRERMWHGWPDPPMYVFFALAGETITAAADFDGMPRRWKLPPAPQSTQG